MWLFSPLLSAALALLSFVPEPALPWAPSVCRAFLEVSYGTRFCRAPRGAVRAQAAPRAVPEAARVGSDELKKCAGQIPVPKTEQITPFAFGLHPDPTCMAA